VAIRSSGHLNPGDPDVVLERFSLGLDALARHVWLGRWNVPEGQLRPQRVLGYPAFNAVVTPDEAFLYGPDGRASVRELRGRSWVVGVLLRPAATPLLASAAARTLRGGREPLRGAPVNALRELMDAAAAPHAVAAVLRDWLAPLQPRVDEQGLLANHACRLAEEDETILSVAALAARAGVTTRTLGRVVLRHTGLTPKQLIERRRLQAAAMQLYTAPDTDLAALAAELGYADQAHFTRRYRGVLGQTPDQTRRAGRAANSAAAGAQPLAR